MNIVEFVIGFVLVVVAFVLGFCIGVKAGANGTLKVVKMAMDETLADVQNALRNQAAIAAMQGYICAPVVEGINPNPSYIEIAEKAVILADALIEELKKQK